MNRHTNDAEWIRVVAATGNAARWTDEEAEAQLDFHRECIKQIEKKRKKR